MKDEKTNQDEVVKDEEDNDVFEEQDELSSVEVMADLAGDPRMDEEFSILIKDKQRKLVPATLRNIPKVGAIVAAFTSGSGDDMSFFTEEKVNKVAELIHLSLTKEDQEEITIDDILDSCSFADFPLAMQACLSLNDFLSRMSQVKRSMESLG